MYDRKGSSTPYRQFKNKTTTELPQKYQPTVDDLNSSVYHHSEKGCDLQMYPHPKRYYKKLKGVLHIQLVYLIRQKCRTHLLNVCKCGFEIGGHFGQLSKGYKPPTSLPV